MVVRRKAGVVALQAHMAQSMAAGTDAGMNAASVPPHNVSMRGPNKKRMLIVVALPLSCQYRMAAETG